MLVLGTALATSLFTWAFVRVVEPERVVMPAADTSSELPQGSMPTSNPVVEPFSMREKMNRVLEEERTAPARDPGTLAAHLQAIEQRARTRGVVDATDLAAGLGALERSGASPEELDAFARDMEVLSEELRGEPQSGERIDAGAARRLIETVEDAPSPAAIRELAMLLPSLESEEQELAARALAKAEPPSPSGETDELRLPPAPPESPRDG